MKAKEKLSSYGRVVFGLTEEEVGHVNPQWSDDRVVEEARSFLQKDKSEAARTMHQNMAMVEWYS
jgi:hypothetical protein